MAASAAEVAALMAQMQQMQQQFLDMLNAANAQQAQLNDQLTLAIVWSHWMGTSSAWTTQINSFSMSEERAWMLREASLLP